MTCVERKTTTQCATAWKYDITALRRRAGCKDTDDASLALWFVRAPWANLAWHSYMVMLQHLRPLPGFKPPIIYLQGATHEMQVFAVDPAYGTPDDADKPCTSRYWLQPLNFAAQMAWHIDAEAIARVNKAVGEILEGDLSPDTDYINQWVLRFGDNMVKEGHKDPKGPATVVTMERPGGVKEVLTFDRKPADARPTCVHGVRPSVPCAQCEGMYFWRKP